MPSLERTTQAVVPEHAGPTPKALPRQNLSALIIIVAGLAIRFLMAGSYFLDPDEALHNLLASHSSLALTWKAALTQAHPPLLIFLLHALHRMGNSELILRTPMILCGIGCAWLTYLWLKRIANESIAWMGLLLLTFAPSLIELSIEVRQYALLLFFMAGCLYLSERALQENSLLCMGLFSFSLYGALLSHYSSFLFAAIMGVYLLVRLFPYRQRLSLFLVWGLGQAVALGICIYFLVTHVSKLKLEGMAQGIADTWLRRSIYHPGENSLLIFPFRQTLRVFTYLFSHGLIGSLALLAFPFGIAFLLRRKFARKGSGPTARQTALLIGLPFVLNCAVAIAGLYPYGGTRHNALLSLFAIAGIAFGLAAWSPNREWIKPGIVLTALFVCNVFPSPPPLIRARNHKRVLMEAAISDLRREAAPGSTILADYESGLLLGYYLCGQGVVQDLPPYEPFSKASCGPYTVISAFPGEWKFYGATLQERVQSAAQMYALAPGSRVWFFDAGWIEDSTPEIRPALRKMGCDNPQMFGQNVLFCKLTVGTRAERQAQ